MRARETRSWLRQTAAALAACVVVAGPAAADNICFNPIGAPALPGPPPVPGDPNDPHWSTVFRFDFHNGTPVADGTLQVGSFGGSLYLQWMIHNAAGFANADRVTVAFKDSNGAYRAIAVQPNCDGAGLATHCASPGIPTCDASQPVCTPANNQPSLQPSFYTATAYTANPAPGQPKWGWQPTSMPQSIVFGAGSTGTGDPNSQNTWWVQIKMPATDPGGAYAINTTPGSWKFYTNALRVDGALGNVTELTWPNNAGNLVFVNPLEGIPDPANWGTANLGQSGCVGIHLTGIRTDTVVNGVPEPLMINYNATAQHLLADWANTGPIDGTCVSATFRIANFGISDAWDIVHSANNPTPPATIAHNSTGTFTAGPWDVTADPKRAKYDPAHEYDPPATRTYPHQCIRVDLSVNTNGCTPSTSGTTFDVASAFQNMDFGLASVFTRAAAEIRGDIKKPPPGKTKNTYDLRPLPSGQVTQNGARLAYAVHATRRTNDFIDLPTGRMTSGPGSSDALKPRPEVIRYEVVERLPSFGYLVDHALSATELAAYQAASPSDRVKWWKFSLSGLKPHPDKPGRLIAELGEKETASAVPRVEYVGNPGDCSTCFCKCGQLKNAPATLIVTALLMITVGGFAYRRNG